MKPVSPPRTVVILGSTGSIGTQALDVVRRNPDRLRVVGLAAGGTRVDLLAEQAVELAVDTVALAASEQLAGFRAALADLAGTRPGFRDPELLVGPEAAADLATVDCDVVLNGITGSIGLGPTLAALTAGRTVALANKESLVAGGPLVAAAAQPGQIVPVDSEHSALAQCLLAGDRGAVRRLVLTASGGPFRGRTRAELESVTVADALAHPTWAMGPVVTVNSATMVNKGLEVIEAHLLFDIPYADIDVVVHPQSVVHSMVEFRDGSTLAQASPPDMRLPIALGLTWPHRLDRVAPAVDWTQAHTWTFEPLDAQTFPAVGLARAAGAAGGLLPAVFNAANEVAVERFLHGRLPFVGIVETVAGVLDAAPRFEPPRDVGEVRAVESWARRCAGEVSSKVSAR